MKIFSYLQKLGRSLLLPVALLPAAAIFLRLGAGDLLGRFFEGDTNVILAAGDQAFKYMPLLFAAGVAIGFSEDGHGTAVLSAILAYLVLSNVGLLWAQSFWDVNDWSPILVEKWEYGSLGGIGQLGGVIAGIIAAACYNKYKNIKLPDVFAFFAAKRFVPIATLFFAFIASGIIGLIWPAVDKGIVAFYGAVSGVAKPMQTAIYITAERLLVPVGLHHILNSLFIFDPTYGDSVRFFAQQKGAGYIMAGSYPLKMFILPALAFAFINTAKEENKGKIKALMVSGALVTFMTGITEPIEFAFLFSLPLLYVAYALWAGIWGAIATASGALHGYGFAAGLIDYLIQFANATKPIILMGIGAVAGVATYFLFKFIIQSMNLKTPGREDNVEDMDDQLSGIMPSSTKSTKKSSYEEKAKLFLKALGGKANVQESQNCATRLRLKVKDSSKIDINALKKAGAVEVVVTSKISVQVIVGPTVQYIADEFAKLIY